jgi:hypothetical protein
MTKKLIGKVASNDARYWKHRSRALRHSVHVLRHLQSTIITSMPCDKSGISIGNCDKHDHIEQYRRHCSSKVYKSTLNNNSQAMRRNGNTTESCKDPQQLHRFGVLGSQRRFVATSFCLARVRGRGTANLPGIKLRSHLPLVRPIKSVLQKHTYRHRIEVNNSSAPG